MRSICRATPLNDIDSEMVFAPATYQIGPRRPFESPALSGRLIWPFVCRGDGGGRGGVQSRAEREPQVRRRLQSVWSVFLHRR
jgi:hypothetical protein